MRWLLGVLLLIGSTSAWAEDDLAIYPEQGLQPFLGLDDTSATTRVAPGRARTIQNVVLGSTADARKRSGLALIGRSLDIGGEDFCTVTGLTYAQFAGATSRIVAICGPRLSYLSGGAWVTSAPLPITAGQNNQFVFTPALSTLIFTNDVDQPLQWDGGASDVVQAVSFSGLTNAITAARTTTFFQNYLIFGNTVEGGTRYPTRVRWGNVGKINTWTNADYIDVDAPAGQELNCMAQLYGDVYLGFSRSLYRMSLVGGSQTFNFTKVSDEAGCVAKNSMQQITTRSAQTGLIFLDGKKNIYFFNGVVPVEIDALIRGTMNGVSSLRLPYAVSVADGEHYLLCLSDSGQSTNQLCLDYNYLLGEWSKRVYIGITGINAIARVTDASSDTQTYLGTGDSFIYQMDNTTGDNDVGGASGVVEAVNMVVWNTASSLQVLYDNDASFTASGLMGAPIELTGGTASGLVGVVVDNTATGLIVAREFSSTPDSTTAYVVGRIDAFYRTRWDDLGDVGRLKHGVELVGVADADTGSTLDIGYAVDFQSNTETSTASLTPSAGSLWGTAVWGVSVWGGGDTVYIGAANRKVNLNDEGRWWSFEFREDDLDESFRLHGWQVIHRKGNRF